MLVNISIFILIIHNYFWRFFTLNLENKIGQLYQKIHFKFITIYSLSPLLFLLYYPGSSLMSAVHNSFLVVNKL